AHGSRVHRGGVRHVRAGTQHLRSRARRRPGGVPAADDRRLTPTPAGIVGPPDEYRARHLAGEIEGDSMAARTIEKRTESVGAEIHDVDHDRRLNDPDLPQQVLDALEQHGVLVFREIHLDDATQVGFSRRLGRLEKLGGGEFPEIFLVTIDKRRNPYADYLR